jgi:electron transport complex protein RnfC
MSLSALPTFGQGGIHPPSHKGLTSEKGIDVLPFHQEVWLPLQQHIGEPATPIVKKGERVVRGQKIADGGKTAPRFTRPSRAR